MNGKDRLEEMLSDKSGTDQETIEKISQSCNVLTDEQKNRILGIIREKESGTFSTETDESGNGEEEMKIVEYRKSKGNIIRIVAGLAACICIVSVVRLLGSKNEQFIPSEDPGKTTTAVSETPSTSAPEVIVTVNSKSVSQSAVTTVSGKADITETTPSGEHKDVQTENSSETAGTAAESTAEEKPESTTQAETAVTESVTSAEQTESAVNDQNEYRMLYKELLDDIRKVNVDPSLYVPVDLSYLLFDMNKDGIPELILEDRLGTNRRVIDFFTVKNHNVESYDTFAAISGTVTFFEDKNTGRLCIENLDDGTGTVTSYDFDGTSFYEVDSVRDFEYGDDYESFRKAAEEKFALSDLVFGRVKNSESTAWSGHEQLYSVDSAKYYFSE